MLNKINVRLLFLTGAFLIFAQHAEAEELLIKQPSEDNIWQMNKNDVVGQSFTATLTGVIKEIGLESNGATIDLEIREGEGAKGKLLYSENDVIFSNAYRSHSMHKLKKPVPVVQGQKYTFIITNRDDWGMRGFFETRKDSYAGGRRIVIKTSFKDRMNVDLSFVIKGEGVNTGDQIIGKAHDITVDSEGNMYAVGSQKRPDGYALYKWAANANTWSNLTGDAVKIAAIPNQAWIINTKGEIFHEAGRSWKKVNGPVAKEIAGGGSDIWIIAQDRKIYRNLLGNWIAIPGLAEKIDIDDRGTAWTVDHVGALKVFKNDRWIPISGPQAVDLVVSNPDFVHVLDKDGNIHELNTKTNKWKSVTTTKDAVAIGGGRGQLIKLTKELDIFRMR